MGLKIKNVNIMDVNKKNNIYGELPKKGGAWTICRGLGKKQGGCF